MSIFPAGDIVSGVAHAADPRKLAVAMKRLDDAARTAAPLDTSRFAAAIAATSSAASTGARPQASATPALQLTIREAAPTSEAAGRKFEAFILQNWLEALLPKEESGYFGSGGAGNVWRSMMAEQLATQIATAGGVGIQRLLHLNHATGAPQQSEG